MDFLKKIFGSKKTNSTKGEDLVVGEDGFAHPVGNPQINNAQPNYVNIKSDDSAHFKNTVTPTQGQDNSDTPTEESVIDTSAFDQLVKEAESATSAQIQDEPVLDPEFRKARDEIQTEEGIEIFPGQ